MIIKALMLATTHPTISAAELFDNFNKVPMRLWYLASKPSGTMFCDQSVKLRQTKRFDELFGVRFNRLAKVIAEREGLGWEPEPVIITPCYRPNRRQARDMLDRFDGELHQLEQRYGL